MPESQNENVNKEVVPPLEGQAVDTQATEQQVSKESRPDSQEKNWKEVRDIMQQQRQEIAELKRQMLEKEQPNIQTHEQNPLEGLAEDDVLTVADAKKLASQIARQTAMDIVHEREKKVAIEQVPNQYSDYQDVIKYVDELVKENPALETAILNSPNPRLTAYQMIKSSHLYQKQQTSGTISPDAQRAINNSQKPISSQSVGTTSPLNDMQKYEKMTKDRAAEIRRLSEEYASRR